MINKYLFIYLWFYWLNNLFAFKKHILYSSTNRKYINHCLYYIFLCRTRQIVLWCSSYLHKKHVFCLLEWEFMSITLIFSYFYLYKVSFNFTNSSTIPNILNVYLVLFHSWYILKNPQKYSLHLYLIQTSFSSTLLTSIFTHLTLSKFPCFLSLDLANL